MTLPARDRDDLELIREVRARLPKPCGGPTCSEPECMKRKELHEFLDRLTGPREQQTWVCPHNSTFSGSLDFISGAQMAHDNHGDHDYSPEFQDEYQRLWHEAAAERDRLAARLEQRTKSLQLIADADVHGFLYTDMQEIAAAALAQIVVPTLAPPSSGERG